jgi:hypothetical protein
MSPLRLSLIASSCLQVAALWSVPASAQRPTAPSVTYVIDAGFNVSAEVHDGFSQITTMAISPAGTIAVLDAVSAQVTVLDARGRLVRQVGRAGRGPGELSARLVQSVTFSGDGTLWVPQASQRRVDRFGDRRSRAGGAAVRPATPHGVPGGVAAG